MSVRMYDVLLAIDVPHYGIAVVEAETAAEAIAAARNLDIAEICEDPDWDLAFCPRIVRIEVLDGETVAEDVQLDEENAFVLVGHPAWIRLARAAREMFAALEAQEFAEFDPEASRRKGYFDRARELRGAALKKARAA